MADRKAVLTAMAALASVFSGDLSREKVGMYAAALADLTDDQLAGAVTVLVRAKVGQFLPVPAEIRAAAGVRDYQPANVESLIAAIDKAGFYSPQTGWNRPRVDKVRELFGPAVATAYGAVGGASRLFSDNDTSREIAERDFAVALKQEQTAPELTALPSETRRVLGQGGVG